MKLKYIQLIINEKLDVIKLDPLEIKHIRITNNFIIIIIIKNKIIIQRDKLYYLHWKENIVILENYFKGIKYDK